MSPVLQTSTRLPPVYSEFFHDDAGAINPAIVEAFAELRDSDAARKTHYFSGRYENIVIDCEQLPGMRELIDYCSACAAKVLGMPAGSLRCGYWFNEMQPSHITEPHSHNDDDELISGVYYLKVPKHSGNLILHEGKERITITPEEGKLVLFSSSNVHEVEENKSDEVRLSIGMNFGVGE